MVDIIGLFYIRLVNSGYLYQGNGKIKKLKKIREKTMQVILMDERFPVVS